MTDREGNDMVDVVLAHMDKLEFLAIRSKAKNREEQQEKMLRKLRDYLNQNVL